jgi:hypothetical protein
MTPQQIEALKLALEALEGFYEYGYDRQECFEHITAIKEALAGHAMRETQRLGQETEQEPVELCQYGQEPASCTSNPMHCQCAIDAALAQPEQEPVAYLCENAVGHRYFRWKKPSSTYKPIPLYTSPSQRKPLTFSKLCDIEYEITHKYGDFSILRFARAIEAAHGIKENT